MWGYDRAEQPELVPFKNQEQHFELFSLVLERGFALHTGHTERLIVDFKLADAGSRRYLPRVLPKEGISFRIPENCLRTSQLYLHYDPSSETDLPELAVYDADNNRFTPYDHENSGLFDKQLHQPLLLPVVKLSTLRGLHYIKDIACLQMFELDFDRLYNADPALAEQVRQTLTRKLTRFVEFTRPWISANRAERVAKEYLSTHATKPSPRKRLKAEAESRSASGKKEPFLSWD